MKITINTKKLLAILAKATKVIPAKTFITNCQNIKVMVTKEAAGFLATDMELSVLSTIAAGEDSPISGEGILSVPAGPLYDIVKTIEDDSVDIDDENITAIKVSWKSGHGIIPKFNPEEFPEVNLTLPDDDAEQFTIKAEDLLASITAIAHGMSSDTIRPILNGMLFHAKQDGLTAVTTDAQRLIICEIPSVSVETESKFVLPSKAVNAMKSIFDQDGEITVRFNENNVIMKSGEVTFAVKPITGKYPDYRKAVPVDVPNELTVDRKMLAETIKRISICSTNHVIMEVKPGVMGATVTVSAGNVDFKVAAKETIPAEYAGEEIKIGFKPEFLLELLAKFPGENIRLSMKDSRHAILAEPVETAEDQKLSEVIMPVYIS